MNHLLYWYNLIFEVPALLAAVLLVLSSLRLGHGPAHHAAGTSAGHGGISAHGHHHASGLGKAAQRTKNGAVAANWRSAPLTAIVGFFGLFWGTAGFLFNSLVIGIAVPTLLLILQSLGFALIIGLTAARGGAELLVRIMPKDETYDVSSESLYGLVGEAAFEVSDQSGRLLVYDQNGTLHDELCRASHSGMTINKGRKVMIVDRDREGHLLVEEVF